MPEAFAVLVVFAIAIFIYVMMWLKSRDPEFYKPKEELVRLQHQMIWLEDRQVAARREHWDAGLQASLVTQIAETVRELDRVKTLLAESDGTQAVEVSR